MNAPVAIANAAFIVTACNAHAELLNGCRQALKVFTDLDAALKRAVEQRAELVHVGDLSKLTRHYVPVLQAAIAKAEGR